MSPVKLYYYESPSARVACAAARQVGATVELIRVDLKLGEQRRPEYLAINPNGKVPTLVDGDTVLWEAPAVACRLAQASGSDFWPTDPAAQIDVIRWMNWGTAHFSQYAGKLYIEHVIKAAFSLGEPDPAVVDESTRSFLRVAKVLEGHLNGRAYLLGDRLSVADFIVATVLPWAEESRLPLERFERIRDWYGRLDALPSWREPYPANAAASCAA